MTDRRPSKLAAELRYWAVHDFEKDQSDKRRKAWSIGFSQLVECSVLEQLKVLTSPVPIVGHGAQKTFFSEDEIRAAFIPNGKRGEGRKHCDAAIWTPTCWVLIEIVNRSRTVATRHLGSLESFRDDTQKMVLEKLEQLDATAADLIDDDSRLSGLPASKQIEIQPVLIQGGRFPVHPATVAYVDKKMKETDLLRRARVRTLAIIHTDEVEMLEAEAERGEPLEDILARWQRSTRRAMPLKNLLLAESGPVPVEHHRPARGGRHQLALPGLDAGLFVGRDDLVVGPKRLPLPKALVEAEDALELGHELGVARMHPTLVPPGLEVVLGQGPPDRAHAHPDALAVDHLADAGGEVAAERHHGGAGPAERVGPGRGGPFAGRPRAGPRRPGPR